MMEREDTMRMPIRSLLALLVVMMGLSACGGTTSQSSSAGGGLVGARDKLVADLRECTQTHGFDPKNAAGVAENALAPNELPWRQCAYDAVRAYGQAHPTLRGMYDQLIAEDLAMTTAIQQGSMTRSQRRARIEELVAQIKAAEQEQIDAAASEQARQNDQLRNVVENVRGFSY
jgi:hypothetical protein